jgi:hypothetical protein
VKLHPKSQRVNFIVVGTQKGGTSALDYYLRQHPDIGMGRRKEVHFFDDENIFGKAKVNYEDYAQQFDFTARKAIYGEATPIYMYWEPCMRRIWEYNKDVKLIAILRDPANRAFSQWNMQKNDYPKTQDFLECVGMEHLRMKKALPHQPRGYGFVDRGFYSAQIRRMQRFFYPEQLLFLKYEDFLESQEETMKQVCEYLTVDPKSLGFQHKKVHVKPYSRKMTTVERNKLVEIYMNDICEVERLLGWDCEMWKTTS